MICKASAKTQDWCRIQQKHKTGVKSYKQNFPKVANIAPQRLKNSLAAFPHALKNILKNDKKLGFIYKYWVNPLAHVTLINSNIRSLYRN